MRIPTFYCDTNDHDFKLRTKEIKINRKYLRDYYHRLEVKSIKLIKIKIN